MNSRSPRNHENGRHDLYGLSQMRLIFRAAVRWWVAHTNPKRQRGTSRADASGWWLLAGGWRTLTRSVSEALPALTLRVGGCKASVSRSRCAIYHRWRYLSLTNAFIRWLGFRPGNAVMPTLGKKRGRSGRSSFQDQSS